ncbi:MAG: fibronectin type III domain-containing protein, partial [Bacteroidales bacterium]|nr:fibronectin type III domain-containing protein [Bacteroidales bacterium]
MQKHLQKLLLIVAMMVVPWVTQGQTLGEYIFSTGTDSSKWVNMSSATQILSPSGSDGLASSLQNIGFTFPFGEADYTQYSVNTDGNLRLGSTVTGTGSYSTPFSSSACNTNSPKINAFGCDGYGNSGTHYVKSLLTEDDNGDTLLAVEFCTGTYTSSTRSYLYKWQIHLYQNGNVEIVFPDSSGIPSTAPAVTHQCGMCVNASDGWIISSSTNTASTFTNGSSTTNASGTWFDANRYYRFERPIITCPRTSPLTQTNATLSSVTIEWTEMGEATAWVLEYDTVDFVPGSGAGNLEYPTTTTYTINGLDSAHSYYIYLHADCGGDTSLNRFILARTLSSTPATIPFYCDFEGDSLNGWELLNGNQTNIWVIDSAVNHGGNKSLYISNDNGLSNAYNTSSISYAYAYRTIDFPDSGEFNYSYDWRSQGESHNYDFTRVFLAPVSYVWIENQNPAESTYAFASWSHPADWIELTEQFGSPANLSQSSTWRTATGTFRVESPSTFNLVFAWANDGSGGTQPPTAIDNIAISMNTCPAPVVAIDHTTTDSIIVTWTPGGSESMWLVVTDSISVVTYDTFFVYDNLAANTDYTFTVRALCDAGDTSLPVTVSGRTSCGAITRLPFFESFEAYPSGASSYAPPDCGIPCWYRLDNASTYHFGYVGSRSSWPSGGHTGTGFLYYYMPTTAGTYADWIITVLPPIDVNEYPINTLQMSFWVKMNSASTSGNIVIGVMSNPMDATSFVPVDTVSVAGNVYAEKEAIFNHYTGTGQYIALRYTRNSSSTTYYFVDDILVERIPDCPAVHDLTANNPSATTVDLSWEEIGTATSWTVEYVADGDPDDSIQTVYASDTSITLTGLRPNTAYTAMVTVDCGSEVGGTAQVSFRTACVFIDSLPYTYGFEDATTGSSSSASFAPCYERLNNGSTYFGYPYVGSSTYNHTPSGSHGLYWYNTTTTGTYGDYQIVVLPGIDTDLYPINTLQFSFWAKASSSSYNPVFQVGVMTDPTNASTFTQVGTVNVGNSTVWDEYTVPLGTYTGAGQYVALKAVRPTSSWYAYVDDFTLEIMPSCPDVEDLNVMATISNALVTWDYDTLLGITPSNYIIQYGYASDSLVGATVLNTSNTSIVLNGLTPDTTYTISVAVDCDGTTGAAAVLNFNTTDFPCLQWDTASGGPAITSVVGTPGTSSTNVMPTNGGYSYAYCNHLIRTSDIDLVGPANITGIDFQFAGSSSMTNKTNCTLYMCHTSLTSCTDFANPTDLVLVYEGPLNCSPSTDGWNHFDFNRNNFAWDGTSNMMVAIVDNSGSTDANATFYYENIGSAISHRVYRNDAPYTFADLGTVTASNSVWRTNMRLTSGSHNCLTPATCGAPAVWVDSVFPNTAYISWIPSHTESAWNIEYRILGSTAWTTAATGVSTTSYTLTGLSANTQYQVRVGSPCSDSTFFTTVAFRTECGLLSALPWSDDLESYSTSSSSTGSAFIPCFVRLNNGTSYGGYPYVSSSSSYSHGGGSKGLYWYNTTTTGSYGDYQCVVLPGIDTTIYPINTLQLRFWAKPSSSSYRPVFQMGIMSDPNDITTFQGIDTVTLTSSDWTVIEVPFTNFTGRGYYPAIKAVRPSSSWYAYVDDFHLELAPSCSRPTNLHSTGNTASSITIDWNERNSATEWEIAIETSSTATPTGDSIVNTHPLTVTGLTGGVNYYFYVRSICGVGDTSAWSEVLLAVPGSWNMRANQTDTLHMCGGIIYDEGGANGNYFTASQNSYIIIQPNAPNNLVSVSGTSHTEGTFDYIRIYDGIGTGGTELWNDYGVSATQTFGPLVSTTGPITVYFHTDGSVYYDGFAINVTCIPTHCRVTNISLDTAVTPSDNQLALTWDTNGAMYYEVEYGNAGFTQGTGTTLTTYTNSIIIPGLTGLSNYDVYVRSICGVGDTGIWSMGTFQTALCANPTELYSYDSTMTATTSSYGPMGYSFYNYGYIQTLIDSAQMAGLTDPINAFA